jgi:hypothetical protein
MLLEIASTVAVSYHSYSSDLNTKVWFKTFLKVVNVYIILFFYKIYTTISLLDDQSINVYTYLWLRSKDMNYTRAIYVLVFLDRVSTSYN